MDIKWGRINLEFRNFNLVSISIHFFISSLSGLVQIRENSNFLFLGGILTFILCIDDFFLLHYKYIGADFLYIKYSIMVLNILAKFIKLIIDIDFLSFIVSVVLLSLSIAFDKTFQEIFPNNYINIQLYKEVLNSWA